MELAELLVSLGSPYHAVPARIASRIGKRSDGLPHHGTRGSRSGSGLSDRWLGTVVTLVPLSTLAPQWLILIDACSILQRGQFSDIPGLGRWARSRSSRRAHHCWDGSRRLLRDRGSGAATLA